MAGARSLRARFLVFLILSGVDLGLTTWLLWDSSGICYEVNPVARWFFTQFQCVGLALFKVIVVLFTIGLLAGLARLRPRAVNSITTVGCALLLGVIGHSTALVSRTMKHHQVVRKTESRRRKLQKHLHQRRAYFLLLERLYRDLREGRRELQHCAQNILTAELPWVPQHLHQLRASSDCTTAEKHIAKSILTDLLTTGTLAFHQKKKLLKEYQQRYDEESGN